MPRCLVFVFMFFMFSCLTMSSRSSSRSQAPSTPMEPGQWPVELEVLCNRTGRQHAHARIDTGSRRERLQTECTGDWRNHIVRPLLRERGVPFVPLSAALSTRSDLHTGGGNDCTHWCEGTEASLFMAQAVLNTMADVLDGARERSPRSRPVDRRHVQTETLPAPLLEGAH